MSVYFNIVLAGQRLTAGQPGLAWQTTFTVIWKQQVWLIFSVAHSAVLLSKLFADGLGIITSRVGEMRMRVAIAHRGNMLKVGLLHTKLHVWLNARSDIARSYCGIKVELCQQ